MQEQIFKDLEKIGHKFSKIEKELEMPQNYLARFKKPENKLPEKWVAPLQKYIERHLINEASQNAVYPLTPAEAEIAPPPKPRMAVKSDGNLSLAPSPEALARAQIAFDKINKERKQILQHEAKTISA